jgi:hypothetical protein
MEGMAGEVVSDKAQIHPLMSCAYAEGEESTVTPSTPPPGGGGGKKRREQNKPAGVKSSPW